MHDEKMFEKLDQLMKEVDNYKNIRIHHRKGKLFMLSYFNENILTTSKQNIYQMFECLRRKLPIDHIVHTINLFEIFRQFYLVVKSNQ